MEKPAITIIGTGALGAVLARAFSGAGFSIKSLYNRSNAGLKELQDEVAATHSGNFPNEILALGEVIFITVSDQNIGDVVRKMDQLSDDFSDRIVVHCSGTKSSAALNMLRDKGAKVASFHPVQTFSSSSVPEDLKNIYFDVEGDAEAVAFLKGRAIYWQSEILNISKDAKPYFHAAAVFASNYMVTLIAAASEMAVMGNIDEKTARKALLPLMQKTFENCAAADDPVDVLSGPVARGDASTVARHLALLNQNPRLKRLYKVLGHETFRLTKSGVNETADREELEKLLDQDNE